MLELAGSLDPGQLAVAGAGAGPAGRPGPRLRRRRWDERGRSPTSFTMSREGGRGWFPPWVAGPGVLRDPQEAALSPLSAPRPTDRRGTGQAHRGPAQRRCLGRPRATSARVRGSCPLEGGGTGTTVLVRCDHDHLQAQLNRNPTRPWTPAPRSRSSSSAEWRATRSSWPRSSRPRVSRWTSGGRRGPSRSGCAGR